MSRAATAHGSTERSVGVGGIYAMTAFGKGLKFVEGL